MGNDLKILVVEDHTLVQDGLCLILQELADNVIAIRANDCQSAHDCMQSNTDISLVLLDIALPDCEGLHCLITLRQSAPNTPIVVVSADNRHSTIRQSIDHGAMGFIPKNSNKSIMLSAIRLVLSGGIYLPTSILDDSDTPNQPLQKKDVNTMMTKRQKEVLALLASGKSNKAIARVLGAAESTIRVHVTAILKTLNASNRTEAVIYARRLGLLADLD